MSHFSLLVVTDKEPTDDVLSATLWPFHEFECTGEEQYIVEVDQTDTAHKEYAEDTTRFYVDPSGGRYNPYEDRFYRDPLPGENVGMGTGWGGGLSWTSKDWGDGRGYRTKVHFLPDGWTEIDVPTPEVESFAEWAKGYYGRETAREGDPLDIADKHKYGYIVVNDAGEVVKVVKRTNINKQWDWWQVGGCYSGRLQSKHIGHCDSCRVSDLNHAAMARQRQAMREETWAEYEKDLAKGRSEQMLEHLYGIKPGTTREQYISADPGLTAFAVLKDGKWYERGDMGWWGIVIDDKGDAWQGEFADIMGGVRSDQWITFVDCHI